MAVKLILLGGRVKVLAAPAGATRAVRLIPIGPAGPAGTSADLTDELAAETAAREAADTALDGRLDALESSQAAQDTAITGKAPTSHGHGIADVTGLQTALDGKAASGHNHDGAYDPAGTAAGLIATEAAARTAGDVTALADAKTYTDGKISTLMGGVPAATLDTIKEIADQIAADEAGAAALAATVAAQGTAIADHAAAADPHTQYTTAARVRSTVLTGLATVTAAAIAATDSILDAFAKLQAQISAHSARTDNPHAVTKAQVGLGNCDNTSDSDKPISSAAAAALATKLTAAYAESSPQVVPTTSNAVVTFTHGLGVTPKKFGFWLVCTVANNGYSVGDRVLFNSFRTTTIMFNVLANSTSVILATASTLSSMYLVPAGGGTPVTLPNTSWNIILWGES